MGKIKETKEGWNIDVYKRQHHDREDGQTKPAVGDDLVDLIRGRELTVVLFLVAALDDLCDVNVALVGDDALGLSLIHISAVRDEYKKRRDTLVRKLREIPGVIFDCPKGAFYLMAALPVDNADTFQRWLLEEFNDNGETVMFAPGAPMYATPGKGLNEVRMAYVLEAEKIERAMDILKKAIEVYNAK